MLKTFFFSLTFIFCSLCIQAQSTVDSLKTVLEKTTDRKAKLGTLNVLTTELVRNNSKEQALYLKDYISLTKELEEYDLMASKSRFLIQYYIYQNQLTMAQKLCDSMLGYKPYFKKQSSEAHVLLKRASLYFRAEDYTAAIEDYENSGELFMKSGDSIFAADAAYFAGQVYADKTDFVDALQQYRKAANLYEILGDEQYAILVGSEITGLYSRNGFVEKGIEERKRLFRKANKNKDIYALAQIVGQNISDYYKIKEYDKLRTELKLMDSIAPLFDVEYSRRYNRLIYLNYKLVLECQERNTSEADKLMLEILEISQKHNLDEYLEMDILMSKSSYYEFKNDEKNLIPVLQKLASIETTNRLNSQIKAREKLSEIYKRQGKLRQAIALQEVNKRVKDSVYNAQKANMFLYYQSEFETEKKQNELLRQDAQIQQLETEQQLADNKRNTAIVGIVIFFLVAISFFYVINQQKIKEQAYQNILLNNKVASKTEEINELLTETMRHIKSKERIAENLQKLSNEKEGITLKSIIADLRASKADNAKLMLIKQNIEQVNFEFIKKLRQLHPELTKTDVEICSLIRIGLSRKEVANLRNTSLEAVKTSRFRLKKKLKLTAEQSLDAYINAL